MTLRFQRLLLILTSLILLFSAVLLILYNYKQNIVYFYTPTEILKSNIALEKNIRIGAFVQNQSFKKISINKYEFKITDNNVSLLVGYEGLLPNLFREGQGVVIEGKLLNKNYFLADKVFAKHDENYMPASIKKQLEKNKYWKKQY